MKKLLTIDQLICHMKSKRIKFTIISEDEAKKFLSENDYYFKLASYRTLYPKILSPLGEDTGNYQNLEFAYLKELSEIDTLVRYFIMEMCLDIEHSLKVRLVSAITDNNAEDGYELVKQFFKKEDSKFYILRKINTHKNGEYCRNLINKYYPYIPIWVLVELVSFGDLIRLCNFYEEFYNCSGSIIPKNSLMNIVRDLRNASAHGNCLLNNLDTKLELTKQPDSLITCFIKNMTTISKEQRRNYLKKSFVYNVIVLLYVYQHVVPGSTRHERFSSLQNFMNTRLFQHKDYFKTNPKLTGTYIFFNKVIDNMVEDL